MESSLCSVLVKKHFRFLVDEYGSTVTHESFHPEAMGNAEVVFESALAGICVVCDRNQVLIMFGLLSQARRDWSEFANVVKVFAPDIAAVYVFPKDYSNLESALESQVSRLAQVMRQYCVSVLRGDFSGLDQARQAEHDGATTWLEEMRRPARKT